MEQKVARVCDIMKRFPCTNPALELYFLLNSDIRLWGHGKPIRLPVQAAVKRNFRQAREAGVYSLRVTQADGSTIIFSEALGRTMDAVLFNVTVIDLQNMIHRIVIQSELDGSAEKIVRAIILGVELGGRLDIWINGVTLSREQVTQVIGERFVKTNGLDTRFTISKETSRASAPERLLIVLDQGGSRKKVTLYRSEGSLTHLREETLTSSIDSYINELFAKYRSIKQITVVDSVTRATLKSKRRSHISGGPPACTLGRDNIDILMSVLEKRRDEPDCSTMARCLCLKHQSCPFTITMFFEAIRKACGDVAMERGKCPMCCVSPNTKSKRPLVRFTEEVEWTLRSDHDWSGFQFRGMLFEMFPDTWAAVENTVYRDKDVVVSSNASSIMEKATWACNCFGVEVVFTSDDIRPWPLYEMALSRNYGRRAHPTAMHYLDMALGQVFLNAHKELFQQSSPGIIIRILISAAQLIPGGDCLLDDSQAKKPLSRSGSHTVGCLVNYESPRLRVLAELLLTWDSVEWNGDVASYLSSIFKEKFRKGAMGYYFNSSKTKAVKVEKFEESLHVTKLCERHPQKKEMGAKTSKTRTGPGAMQN